MENFFLVWVFIIGLAIGSFLNCLLWRLHQNESLSGRSYCPRCRQTIAWHDNIPLLSFLWLRGRCRSCRQEISWQYPLVEFATALFFLLTWQLNMAGDGLAYNLLRDWLLVATFIVIFVYDWRWQLVPMMLVWPMMAIVFALNLLLGFSLTSLLLFGAIGTAFFLIQYLLTARRGVGEGDIWIGALLGLTFPNAGHLFLIMLIAYVTGAAVGLGLMLLKKKGWRSRLALGPFLVLGAMTALLWGDRIIAWYLSLL